MTELIEIVFGVSIFKMTLAAIVTGAIIHMASRTTARYTVILYCLLALTVVYMISEHHIKTPTIIFMTIGQIVANKLYRLYQTPETETGAAGNAESFVEKWAKDWYLGPWLYGPGWTKREETERKPMTSTKTQECLDLRRPDTYEVRLEVNSKGERALLCPCCEGNGEHSNLSGNNPAAVLYPCGTCGGSGEITPSQKKA